MRDSGDANKLEIKKKKRKKKNRKKRRRSIGSVKLLSRTES
jgi:hypothetical protein